MAKRNKVELIGNLGKDPDVRYTANGNPVANLAIATDESYKDRNTGQKVEKTEWHRVVVFGKPAEFAGQYLAKGAQVFVEGKLQTRKWQDQSGQDRYTTEIVVDITGELQSLGARTSSEGSAQQGSAPAQGQQQSQQPAAAYAPEPEFDDEPFPF